MIWLGLGILAIIGGYFYFKNKSSLTLNKEQAEMVGDLISKEKKALADQMHDMADQAALKGATVSVDSIIQITPDFTEDMIRGAENYRQELIDKYGPTIPVNTAHRLSWEMDGNGKMWSDCPGCFERHLQRRDGNILFPPERRLILRKDIEEAVEKDRIEAQLFKIKHRAFVDSKLVATYAPSGAIFHRVT